MFSPPSELRRPGGSALLLLLLLLLIVPLARPMVSRVGRCASSRSLEQLLVAALSDENCRLPLSLRRQLLQPTRGEGKELGGGGEGGPRGTGKELGRGGEGGQLARPPLVGALAHALHLWRERGEWPWELPPVPDMTELEPRPRERYAHLTPRAMAVRNAEDTRLLLDELGEWGTLSLLKCRHTAGSVPLAPPDLSDLLAAFCAPHSGTNRDGKRTSVLTVGARALSKHCHRSASGFWGECTGGEVQRNTHALRVLREQIISQSVWMNMHVLPGSQTVFELRQAEGFGARWSADGRAFRGFVEPHAWDIARRAAQAGHTPSSGAPASTAGGAGESALPPSGLVTAAGSHLLDMAGRQLGDRVHVVGYGSLVDEEWARADTPSLADYQLGWLKGYARCFNLVSIINIRRGNAIGRRLVSCTAVARPGCSLRVAIFSIPTVELPDLLKREARLRPAWVKVMPDRGEAPIEAIVFTGSDDERYLREACGGDAATYHTHVGQFYTGKLYRNDLLPVHSYMMRCLRAHRRAGRQALVNFLEQSFLGDGATPLRDYLEIELEAFGQQNIPASMSSEVSDTAAGLWTPEDVAEAHVCLGHCDPHR